MDCVCLYFEGSEHRLANHLCSEMPGDFLIQMPDVKQTLSSSISRACEAQTERLMIRDNNHEMDPSPSRYRYLHYLTKALGALDSMIANLCARAPSRSSPTDT